jgi:hypothetical protein
MKPMTHERGLEIKAELDRLVARVMEITGRPEPEARRLLGEVLQQRIMWLSGAESKGQP